MLVLQGGRHVCLNPEGGGGGGGGDFKGKVTVV